MNNAQTLRLMHTIVDGRNSMALAYVVSVLITEFQDAVDRDPERIEQEYGTCFNDYLEELIG